MSDEAGLDGSHLPLDEPLSISYAVDEMTLPDVYVGLEADLLAPGDGIVTDRHHASADRYEADDPQNQIAGQLSPFALSGWLRHGCERVVQAAGATACHPGEPDANYRRAEVYERDLDAGYHEKGACVDGATDPGCIVYELFGGFGDRPGTLVRRPLRFSPIRSQVDVTDGEAEGHFRKVSTQVRSRNEADAGQPLRHAERGVVGNLEGTWKLTLRELKPEFVGLLVKAVSYLDAHSDEFDLQLGGARNFGAGMVDATVLNPLYTTQEISCVYNRNRTATKTMDAKDEAWHETCRDEFVRALHARLQRDTDDGDGHRNGNGDGNGDGAGAEDDATGGEGA